MRSVEELELGLAGFLTSSNAIALAWSDYTQAKVMEAALALPTADAEGRLRIAGRIELLAELANILTRVNEGPNE